MNENQGNSVIASGTTRAGANQSYAPPAASSRAPSRLPSTSTSTTAPAPARRAPSSPRIAAQRVAPSVNTAAAVSPKSAATATL